MSSRLRFTHNRPANTDNHYVVGSGIGSKSRFVRSALRRRSSNNSQGKPCCSSKNKIPENKSCLNGMVWKECGSACTPTCDNPTPICTKQCVAGCECPQGHVLHGGKCVDVKTCNPSLGIEQPEVSCSVYGVSGNYIKDSSNLLTKYCCKTSASDPSGCTSGSTGDVCYDTTSDNSGSEKCLVDRFGKTNCSSPPQPPPSAFHCKQNNGNAYFAPGASFQMYKVAYPTDAADIQNENQKKAPSWISGPAPQKLLTGTTYMSGVELAKAWILATNKLSKTTKGGVVMNGGYPTCSRAIAVATAEGGGDVRAQTSPSGNPPWVANDPSFYGAGSGCIGSTSGGCWQTSNVNSGPEHVDGFGTCNKDNLDNPFCNALIAFTHEAGSAAGIQDYPACTKLQYQTGGIKKKCYMGALLSGGGESSWNSPPQTAAFRTCSTGSPLPLTKPWTQSCPYGKAQYSCERASCACDQARDELVSHYGDGVIDTIVNDPSALKEFEDACKEGPILTPVG